MPSRNLTAAATTPDVDAIRAFVASMPVSYRTLFDIDAIEAHAAIVEKRGQRAAHVEMWRELPERVVAIAVVADDAPGLLSRISAAMVAHEIDVVAAQAYCRTTPTTRVEAVDFFWIRRAARPSGGAAAVAPLRERDIDALGTTLEALVRGRASFARAVRYARAVRGAGGTARVRFDDAEGGGMILSVEAADRPGLLLLLTDALFRERVQIVRSDVSTHEGTATDRFHLMELDGAPLRRGRALGIQTAVLAAIEAWRRDPKKDRV
jgi:[protein-PII] uridylyltransferase